MPRSTITSKGQITVPAEVRRRLKLAPGDELVFQFRKGDELIVVPAKRQKINSLAGMLHHLAKPKPVSIDEMKQAVLDEAAEHFAKSGRTK